MTFDQFYAIPGEKPLDNLINDGGFCGIFRTIGCIGDSLASGEFETLDNGIKGYHDFYEYSWGQYMARTIGNTVYNFSRGGMSAKWFCDSFANECGVYKRENLCQAYIIALGVNDVSSGAPIGDINAITPYEQRANGDESILAYYAQIMRTLISKQPDAKLFLMTLPELPNLPVEKRTRRNELNDGIRKLAEKTKNTYVLDFNKYAPPFDEKFQQTFMGGHMTAAGYLLISKMVMSYMDYIIRHNHKDFADAGLIGTPYYSISVRKEK